VQNANPTLASLRFSEILRKIKSAKHASQQHPDVRSSKV